MTRIAFSNGRVFDGGDGEPRSEMTVLVEGENITAVAPDEDIHADETYHIGGKTIIPGLIDAHVHLSLTGRSPVRRELAEMAPSDQVLRAAGAAERTLRGGFTTVRDVGACNYIDIALREAIERGDIPGPRVVASGPGICQTGGSGDFEPPWQPFPSGSITTPVDSPRSVRAAVRQRIKRGVDSIKAILSGDAQSGLEDESAREFTTQEVRVLYEEAHASGTPVAAHCMTPRPLEELLDEGVLGANGDTIEHGIFLHRNEAVLEAMADSGVAFVPTLTIYRRIADNEKGTEQGTATVTRDDHLRSVRAALDAGVTVACGTDMGGPGAPHGDNAEELRGLVDAGMTPAEAITAATRDTARALGISDQVGTIESGKVADFLVVDGRPDRDIATLTEPNIDLVVRDGDPVVGELGLV